MKQTITQISTCFLLLLIAPKSFAQKLTSYVDPFIGTARHGHTFPGATVPFGMVQLSPDTGMEGWDWSSGYHSNDSTIIGFSHTHLSGTGSSDYGDILIMPTMGAWQMTPGTKENPDLGYRSRFRRSTEQASPGYYSVLLDDYDIKAELTTTKRVGFHRYTFPRSAVSNIIVDLQHGIGDQVVESSMKVIGQDEVVGMRRSKGWAPNQVIYFALKFSKPFKKHSISDGEDHVVDALERTGTALKGVFRFSTTDGEEILLKVGLSSVSTDGARANLQAEIPHWDFDQTKKEADAAWESMLSKVRINDAEDPTDWDKEERRRMFYTALYHCFMHPNVFSDVNGSYRGMDEQTHIEEEEEQYTVFALWDSFRSLHPLFSLIDPEQNNAFARSLLNNYRQSGQLPLWELAANNAEAMPGYHAVPVLADMILKDLADFDINTAYQAMKKSAGVENKAMTYYKSLGFIPYDQEPSSVPKTMEYAFDDWCIAQVAHKLGREDDYKYFLKRALSYRNLTDAKTGYARGRNVYGVWNPNYKASTNARHNFNDFTEADTWQYSFYALQDVNGLIEQYGGDDLFNKRLDSLFNERLYKSLLIEGLNPWIGQYSQGNPPSHHVPYLYNYSGQPWKTQSIVHQIRRDMYGTGRDGLASNDDCGQLSAWYVWACLGIYPVNPVSGDYIIGTPAFESVTINAGAENAFTIEAKGLTPDKPYIQSAQFKGKAYKQTFISDSAIRQGGRIVFEMGNKANLSWGSAPTDRPLQRIEKYPEQVNTLKPLLMPYEVSGRRIFDTKKAIILKSESPDTKIFYTINGDSPTAKSKQYTGAFNISKSTFLKAVTIDVNQVQSTISEISFLKSFVRESKSRWPKLSSNIVPNENYTNKADALLDGRLGSFDYQDGRWVAFNGPKMNMDIELEKPVFLKNVKLRFLQHTGSWIFLPQEVNVQASVDGKKFFSLGKFENDVPMENEEVGIRTFQQKADTKEKIKFLKIEAINTQKLPGWHSGAGKPAWLFTDEVILEH